MNKEDKIHDALETILARMDIIQGGINAVDAKLTCLEETMARVENDHGTKLTALFDGYTQLDAKIDRIEDKVSAQDEVILRKVFPK
jgi:predicted nuclease with TOPRIM domain